MKANSSAIIFASCLVGVVLASVIAGLFTIDSPFAARSRKLDQQKIVDLRAMEQANNTYMMKNHQLPDNLDQLRQSDHMGLKLSDDEDQPYEYIRSDATSYQLCATFDLPSDKKNAGAESSAYFLALNADWDHPAGHYCFSRTVPERLLPKPTPVVTPAPVAPTETSSSPVVATVQHIAPTGGPICKARTTTTSPVITPSTVHGCAVFGGTTNGLCADNPILSSGQTWTPPAGVTGLYVLAIGGGGGGGASVAQGIGGSGGGSGEVVTATVVPNGTPFTVQIGAGGNGGGNFMAPGMNGGNTIFGNVIASGGFGGRATSGGSGNAPHGGGSNGGGGGGGGNYVPAYHSGSGGSGGTGGGISTAGSASTDVPTPIQGTVGGISVAFPPLCFTQATISAGSGGAGGAYAQTGTGYGGAGGGGGGGLVINDMGFVAESGASSPAGSNPIYGGAGGNGYGAGGGGGGNYRIGSRGGAGASGVIYVEW